MYKAEDNHDLVQDPFQFLLRSFLVSGTQLRVHVLRWIHKKHVKTNNHMDQTTTCK